MQKKYGNKGKKLCFAFIYLEKVLDRAPREVTRRVLKKVSMEKWLVNSVMAVNEHV